jgi:hypothetical protein
MTFIVQTNLVSKTERGTKFVPLFAYHHFFDHGDEFVFSKILPRQAGYNHQSAQIGSIQFFSNK